MKYPVKYPDFIFTSGLWLGEGKISFSASPESLKFFTKWEMKEESPEVMTARHIVEIQEMEHQVINHLTFTTFLSDSFAVILENDLVGSVKGKGIWNHQTIAWEFRNQPNFEGFETYEKQDNGEYVFHAEYGGTDSFRTIIEGILWRKN